MDQATSLRKKFNSSPEGYLRGGTTKSLSITSGKGGVGKTSVSINLSYDLALMGHKVLLVDCDFGLANVDIMLDLHVTHSLEKVLAGEVSMEQVILSTSYGFDVLPASSGMPEIADMQAENQKFFLNQLAHIQNRYDLMVFDTGAGIHKSVLRVNAAADHVLVVTNCEPTSITDAYSIIKTLRGLYKIQTFYLLVTQSDPARASRVHQLLIQVAESNGLLVEIIYLGHLSYDATIQRSIFKRKPWRVISEQSPAVVDLKKAVLELEAKLYGKKEVMPADSLEVTSSKKHKYRFWRSWFQLGQE